jgi:hypothetical protein
LTLFSSHAAMTASCHQLLVNIKQSRYFQVNSTLALSLHSLCTQVSRFDDFSAFDTYATCEYQSTPLVAGKSSVGYLEQITANILYCGFYSPMPGCRDRPKFHFDPSAPAALIQRAIRAINSDDLPRSAVLAAQKITRLSLHSTAKTVSPLFGQGPVSLRLWVACTGRG